MSGRSRSAPLSAGMLLVLLAACRRSQAPPPSLPAPAPTAPPVAAVVMPTAPLPPELELAGKVPPSIEKKLTSSAPATPPAIGESPADRSERLAPPTAVPTVRADG